MRLPITQMPSLVSGPQSSVVLEPGLHTPPPLQLPHASHSQSSPQVRDFRGAMMGRADKGIIITTGTFTADARREAFRDGVPPIELVDGDKLVDMLEELELGLRPVRAYEVDARFFDAFR